MASLLSSDAFATCGLGHEHDRASHDDVQRMNDSGAIGLAVEYPLPNVWLGRPWRTRSGRTYGSHSCSGRRRPCGSCRASHCWGRGLGRHLWRSYAVAEDELPWKVRGDLHWLSPWRERARRAADGSTLGTLSEGPVRGGWGCVLLQAVGGRTRRPEGENSTSEHGTRCRRSSLRTVPSSRRCDTRQPKLVAAGDVLKAVVHDLLPRRVIRAKTRKYRIRPPQPAARIERSSTVA